MKDINFVAIDFETATGCRASICEAGICIVKNGKVAGTKSWLVRPEDNVYNYYNIQVHGIHPEDTEDAPEFPQVWTEIEKYLDDSPVLVAHNAPFDIGCIRSSLEKYGMVKSEIYYFCSLATARRIYNVRCNKLDYLCDRFGIEYGTHHRAGDDAEMCARLFLQELEDAGVESLKEFEKYRKLL